MSSLGKSDRLVGYILKAWTLFERHANPADRQCGSSPCISCRGTTPRTGSTLMPMPTSVQLELGRLAVDQSFSVTITGFRDATLKRGIHRFCAEWFLHSQC